MKLNHKNFSGKSEKYSISTVMYIAALVVALIGVALLIVNIFFYITTVQQYVAQGYPISSIVSNLVPSQLLPGIFQPIAVYGGITFILFGVGKINKNVFKCLTLLTKDEHFHDATGESISGQNIVNVENVDTIEQAETQEEVKKT